MRKKKCLQTSYFYIYEAIDFHSQLMHIERMQTNTLIVDDRMKIELEKVLLETILDGVSSHQMNLTLMKNAAGYILDNIANVKNYQDLLVFLENMNKWSSSFKKVLTIYQYKKTEEKEKEVMGKLSSYIKNIN